MENKKVAKDIDEYVAKFPLHVKAIMLQIRELIRKNAPDVTEGISWGMPTFKLQKPLIHFAGHKKHLGVYPSPETIEHFKNETGDYKTSKGGIQFPYDKPIPYELIEKIVKYNVSRLRRS